MRYLVFVSLFAAYSQTAPLPNARDLRLAASTPEGARAVLTAARQERRVALIIGNDAYPDVPLKNAVNDARAIDKAVTDLEQKFETVLLENAKLSDMQRAVGRFVDRLQENDVAMIYYAGHGIQLGDENYLVPVDFAAEDAASAKFAAYNANELLERVGAKKPKLLLVMLDACRNNPFKVTRSMGTGGLAPVGAGVKGSIIVLSTAPGRVATDNATGNNTYFNMAVVENISKKGLDVNELFNEVKRSVSAMSRDEQRPWTNSDYAGRWYFHPPDDFLPSDIDPAVSERLYKDSQAAAAREDYASAARLFDQVAAREEDSPMGVAAVREAKFVRSLEALQKDASAEVSAGRIERLTGAWELEPYRAAPQGLQAAAQKLALGDIAGSVAMLTKLGASANEDVSFRARKMLTALASVSPDATKVLASPPPPDAPPAAAVIPESRYRKVAEEMAREAAKRAEEAKAAKEAAAAAAAAAAATALTAVVNPTDNPAPVAISTVESPATPTPTPIPTITPTPTAMAANVEPNRMVLPPGLRVRVATLSVLEPVAQPVVATPAAPVSPEPTPAPNGRKPAPPKLPLVTVTSTPPGAAVTFGEAGVVPCVTPCEFRAPAGRYTASLKMSGYRDELRIFPVVAPNAELQVGMEAKKGRVILECVGATTGVELDGKTTSSQCPGELDLPPGQYELTLWDENIRLQRVRVDVADRGLEKVRFSNR